MKHNVISMLQVIIYRSSHCVVQLCHGFFESLGNDNVRGPPPPVCVCMCVCVGGICLAMALPACHSFKLLSRVLQQPNPALTFRPIRVRLLSLIMIRTTSTTKP